MELLRHNIETEFPELRNQIQTLRTSHDGFARLYERYDEVNRTITKVEMGNAVMTEQELDDLKKQRVKLKDDITQILRKS